MFSNSLKFCLAALLAASSLSGCGLIGNGGEGEVSSFFDFGDNGKQEADLAVVAYTQGNFNEAETHVLEALHDNKQNAQALLVGALLSEKTNRPNRARQYYEDILLYNSNEVSVLGASGKDPQKISDIARTRLRQLNLSQNKLIVEDAQGNKVFNMSNQAAAKNNGNTIKKAFSARPKTTSTVKPNDIEDLFDDGEKNTIARFMILKELAETDLITKDEFLRARQANIGGLLPLSYAPASSQVVKAVPTADIIIDRINALKAAVEDRAITAKEFAAERNLIIEAVLPPRPAQRLKRKTPSKDIISAAKDLRKLEVIYDLNLITSNEKEKERNAIEQSLGLRNAEEPAPAAEASQPENNLTVKEVLRVVEPEMSTTTVQEPAVVVMQSETILAPKPTETEKPLLPDVSSPFNK